MFYSTFEPMVLPMGGPMDAMGVQKLYAPSPTPILYVGLAANVLGRVPLMPLFLLGKYTPGPIIPHQLRQHWSARFPHGLAYAADEFGRKGSVVATSRANVHTGSTAPLRLRLEAGVAGVTVSGATPALRRKPGQQTANGTRA